MTTKEEYQAYLRKRMEVKKIPGVQGIGLAGPDIIVYVEKATPAILRELPEDVDGIPILVKEVDKLKILPAAQGVNRLSLHRPAPGGVSVGHFLGETGTLGCSVRRGEEVLGLGNNHVVALQWGSMKDGRIGDAILQPGLFDYEGAGAELGSLVDYVPVPLEGEGNVSVDAALFEGDLAMEVIDLGLPGPAAPMEQGMLIGKSGRTTGLTTAYVETIGAVVDIEGFGVAEFRDVAISDRSFSAGGDSGSLVFDNWARSIGVVFAGSERATVMMETTEVERLLGVTFGWAEEPRYVGLPEPMAPFPTPVLWAMLPLGGLLMLMSSRRSGASAAGAL